MLVGNVLGQIGQKMLRLWIREYFLSGKLAVLENVRETILWVLCRSVLGKDSSSTQLSGTYHVHETRPQCLPIQRVQHQVSNIFGGVITTQ